VGVLETNSQIPENMLLTTFLKFGMKKIPIHKCIETSKSKKKSLSNKCHLKSSYLSPFPVAPKHDVPLISTQ
jgi:hypothetical protein